MCRENAYDSTLFENCITDKYCHICDQNCEISCVYLENNMEKLWICHTCHRKLLKGKMPAECFSNNLQLEVVPPELECLNTLEQHLISLNIPFMKVLCLPKGGQKGVHGPVVCVPSNVQKVTSTLPRSNDESLLLKVKLKRKLTYKGYEEYQFVNRKHLDEALLFLKENNIWYSDITLEENWQNPIPQENLSDYDSDNSKFENFELIENSNEEEQSYLNEKLQGIELDTCLQPADIGQEV